MSDTIVSNNIWIKFESRAWGIIDICTIASTLIICHLIHMDVLRHHVWSILLAYQITWQQCTLVKICTGSRHTYSLLCRRVELDHHSTVHLCPVHVVDALHSHQVAVLGLHLHVHHVLVTSILVLPLTVVQMLMD